jgi:transposase
MHASTCAGKPSLDVVNGSPIHDILRLRGISNASLHRDLHAYVTSGIAPLKPLEPRRPRRALPPHRATIDAACRQHPPATVAEAATRSDALTGIARKPTQGRQFLHVLGRRPRRVGVLPAKADGAAQEVLKKRVGASVS